MQTNMQHTPTRDHAAAVPLGDFDVVEDGNTLVNRLYYAFCIPSSALSSIFAWVSLYIKVA
ncbi:unknown [Firmicutes bacterium CAG:94]|nr:unknown [Firmicutes bacterium CAG:94]